MSDQAPEKEKIPSKNGNSRIAERGNEISETTPNELDKKTILNNIDNSAMFNLNDDE
ncbi:hypothetical protein [Priestia megaterium]|uniref:hypothetical protein n=1 Tax=Priestia megaterium TaxID=1404 RepID=UPI0013EA1BC2|nr:hypothetical protein [Priestia megaterium]